TMAETDPKSVQDLTNVVQTLLQQMQDKFQTITRIDDLEKNIADLMTQAGVEEAEATPEKPKESQGSS
uniref:Heat shock factor binding protein 1b n=1 Tax=Oryzias sinensis TaxID=183150 RepID=A0A8C7YLK4_9TELE